MGNSVPEDKRNNNERPRKEMHPVQEQVNASCKRTSKHSGDQLLYKKDYLNKLNIE